MNISDLYNLDFAWTAKVKLNNNNKAVIWWTSLRSYESQIKEVISVSSDLPRYYIK